MVFAAAGGADGGARRPRVPFYDVSYEGKGITEAIAAFVEKIELTEELEGQSDSVTMTLNNFDLRWLNEWRPTIGERLTVSLGYRGEAFTEPVQFEVDEPTFKFVPDVMQLKGQATPVVKPIRQRYNMAFEGYTLADLAQWVADKHGLNLIGNVPPIQFERVTQKNEPDLAWLKKQALRYGVIFKVENCENLIFYIEEELEAMPPAITLIRSFMADDGSSSLKVQATDTYQKAQTDYKDPKTGEWYIVEVQTNNPFVKVDSVLRITGERFETVDQAAQRCKEALRKANSTAVEGTFDVEGEVFWRAGMNIALSGDRDQFGYLGGKYQIRKVKHSMTPKEGRKQGWRTSLDVRLISGGQFVTTVREGRLGPAGGNTTVVDATETEAGAGAGA